MGNFYPELRAKLGDALRANFIPLLIVCLIFLLALFLRGYFAYDISASNDWIVSGGSDSYYYQRLMDHAAETGEHLHYDDMLNYPDGARNPRPPFYTFSVAVPAVFLQGMFDSISDSLGFFLIWSSAFWGALTIIPTYLIARELFGRKTGYIAALFLAILPTHVERSVATLADHDPFVLFFIVLTVYFLMKAMKAANNSKWVENWLNIRSVYIGLRAFSSQNQKAIIYSLLAGLSFSAIALAWVGFAYVEVIILAFFLVQVLINKFKKVDSTSVTLLFLIMFGFAFLLAWPVYWQMWMIGVRFDVPVYLFFAAIVFGLLFSVTRDLPWVIILPMLSVLIAIAMAIIMIFDPALGEAIFTGQGYFFKSKLYETIAEARAPQFSELAISFGMVTFVLSIIGLFLMLSKIPRRVSGDFIIVSIWMTVAIFMATSAGRFMFNVAPAFALSSAWTTSLIIERLDFQRIAKLFAGSSGSIFQIIRKSVKVRHVVGALFLAFLLILPNTWYAIDAGIPHESKMEIDAEIYNAFPSFMRPDDYRGLWYLGAFGYSLPLPTQYFPAYWNWFAEQDSDILPENDRPAYVSWWDYGFEAIQEGHHPSVADNFQQGYQIAGNILLSQSEEEAIGLFIARIIKANLRDNGGEMTPELSAMLSKYGASPEKVMDVFNNGTKYKAEILQNPDVYGSATSDISTLNIIWRYLGIYFADIGIENEVSLYNALRNYAGYDIGYIGVDSRLIQKSATDGSVFYAPVKLTDRVIDPSGNPSDYYLIKAIDEEGIEYDLSDPELANAFIIDYKIEYQAPFFDTLLYRAFAGIVPSDVGQPNDGLPGYSGSMQSDNAIPGWNLTHFMMVYRTAYYNPTPDASADWRAVSLDDALKYQEEIDAGEREGVVDASSRALYQAGATMLKYYDGAVLTGAIADSNGDPAPGIRITVLDEQDIPHQTILSDSEGYYSVILPPGDTRVLFSSGAIDGRVLIGETFLSEFEITVSEQQAMREPIDEDGDGIYDWNFVHDIVVNSGTIGGNAFWDVDRDGNLTQGTDTAIATGTVITRNLDNGLKYTTELEGGTYELIVSPGNYELDTIINDIHTESEYVTFVEPDSQAVLNIIRNPTVISGYVVMEDGTPVPGAKVLISSESEDNPMEEALLQTDSSGAYSFNYLLPGEYSLSVNVQNFATFDRSVVTTVSAPNTTVYFTLRLLGELNVQVSDSDGKPMSNASISIVNCHDPSESTILVADEDGYAITYIPYGRYSLTVRIPTGNEVLVGGTSVDVSRLGIADATIIVDRGVLLSGTLSSVMATGSSQPEPESRISFSSGPTYYFTSTNKTGHFSVFLPEGDYEAVFRDYEQLKIATMQLHLSSPKTISVDLENDAVAVNGIVWHDRDGNDLHDAANESVPNAFVRVTLLDGVTLRTRTNILGEFELIVPDGESVAMYAEAMGYQISSPQSFVARKGSVNRTFEIDLAPVPVEGILLFEENPLPGIDIRFVNSSQEITLTTGADGRFSGSILPAVYDIEIVSPLVPGSDEYYYASFENYVVYVGISITNLTLVVQRCLRITGDILGVESYEIVDIFFESPVFIDSVMVNESYEAYLLEGDYVCFAYTLGTTRGSALFTFEVSPGNLVQDISLGEAYKFSTGIDFGQNPSNVTFLDITSVSTGADLSIDIQPNTKYSLVLPTGAYDLHYETHILEESGGQRNFYFLLTNRTTIELNSDLDIQPFFDTELDNSSMLVTILDKYGNPLQATLDFGAMNNFAKEQTYFSDVDGIIDSTIHPGYYAVYLSDLASGLSYLGTLGVSPNIPVSLNFTASDGHLVKLISTADNRTDLNYLSLKVTASSSGAKYDFGTLENRNTATVILPSDEYTFEIKSDIWENEMIVTYSATIDLNVANDIILNVPLTKDARYSFDARWDSSQRQSIYPEESVNYSIEITNRGNMNDSYALSGSGEDFEFIFPEEPLVSKFGYEDNTVTVPVEIKATADAQVSHGHVTITVTSEGDPSVTSNVEVFIDILPVYLVEVTPSEMTRQESGSYISAMQIVNIGNDLDNYTFIPLNEEELYINGWDLNISDNGGEIGYVTELGPGEVEEIELAFAPNRVNPNSNVSAVVMVISNSSSDVYAVVEVSPKLPNLSFEPSGEMEVEGNDIFTNDIFAERSSENLMLLIALLVLVASIFVVRKIKFGRFLR